MSAKSLTENQFLVILAFVVMVFSVPTYFSLIDTEAVESVASESAGVRRDVASLEAPASETALVAGKAEVSLVWDFGCGKVRKNEDLMLKAQNSVFHLKGKLCAGLKDMQEVHIENQANGYVASVFALNGQRYQTDLIQLKPGVNQIQVRYPLSSGRLAEENLLIKLE